MDLGLNDLGDPGVLLLCEGLRYPDYKLQTLWLCICQLGSDTCAGISQVLQVNTCPQELDLSFKDLGDRGLWLMGEGKTPGLQTSGAVVEEKLRNVEEQRKIHEERMKLEQEHQRPQKEEQKVILGQGKSRPNLSFSLKTKD